MHDTNRLAFRQPSAFAGERGRGGRLRRRAASASAVHAGFRRNPERFDLALVRGGPPRARSRACFTTNLLLRGPGAALTGSTWPASGGRARAVVVNSAVANAATGEPGRS